MAAEPEDAAGTADPEGASKKPSAVNSQVTDSVSALAAMTAGQAPVSSASMLSLVAAETAALGLYNAVARQQADATISSASVAALCARMLGSSGPADAAAAVLGTVAAAEAHADAGIRILQTMAGQPGGDSAAANAALMRLAAAASAPHPAPARR